MAKFTEDQTCAKCGYHGIGVKWDPTLEVLDVQCVRCGYTWMCRPLDYGEYVVKESEKLPVLNCAECGKSLSGTRTSIADNGRLVHYATECFHRYQAKIYANADQHK